MLFKSNREEIQLSAVLNMNGAAQRMGNNGREDKRQKERDKGAFFFWRTDDSAYSRFGMSLAKCIIEHKTKKNKQTRVYALKIYPLPPCVRTHTSMPACHKLQPAPSSTVQRLSPVEASLTQKKKNRHTQTAASLPNGPESAGIVSQTFPLRLECSIYCFVSLDAGAHAHRARVVFFFSPFKYLLLSWSFLWGSPSQPLNLKSASMGHWEDCPKQSPNKSKIPSQEVQDIPGVELNTHPHTHTHTLGRIPGCSRL